MTAVLTIDGTTSRADLITELATMNRNAKRCQHVVELLSGDPPTEWTVAHRGINALLDWLDQADT